jgi:hypothetical protein
MHRQERAGELLDQEPQHFAVALRNGVQLVLLDQRRVGADHAVVDEPAPIDRVRVVVDVVRGVALSGEAGMPDEQPRVGGQGQRIERPADWTGALVHPQPVRAVQPREAESVRAAGLGRFGNLHQSPQVRATAARCKTKHAAHCNYLRSR